MLVFLWLFQHVSGRKSVQGLRLCNMKLKRIEQLHKLVGKASSPLVVRWRNYLAFVYLMCMC